MALDIRPLGVEDLPAAAVNLGRYFLFGGSLRERVAVAAKHWLLDRHLGAFADGELVGLAGALSLETTVPGGRYVPTSGITRVGVLPTHTGAGILAALMAAQFQDSRQRGEPLSSLRASEAGIYGRFGYGLAGQYAAYQLETVHARFALAPPRPTSIRLLPAGEVTEVVPALYENLGRRQVGAINRPAGLWNQYFNDFSSEPLASDRWVAVHTDGEGQTDGYVDYEASDRDRWSQAGNVVSINDLVAANPVAYAALWHFVLNQGLVAAVKAAGRPLDEPLRHLLADPRRLETTSVTDEQWVRLLDVGLALAARDYPPASETVALAVTDRILAHNNGTYVVGGGSAQQDDDTRADLSLDVATLGAAYLGGTSFGELAAAGLVREHTSGAVGRADTAFATRPLPWCGSHF